MILKVITFNMCHGDNNNGIIDVINQANTLKKYNADIILLQEVDICTKRSNYVNELELFKSNIGLEYSSFGANIGYEDGWYGNAIISRFPIISSENYLTKYTEYSKETKGMLHVKIDINRKIIDIFNTHLPVYEKERIYFTETVINMMMKSPNLKNIILGGDLNIGKIHIGNHKYKFEKKEKYEELEELKRMFLLPEFNDNTWQTQNPVADIDKIMYNGDIKFIKIEKIEVKISDHFPVYAEFEI